MESRNKRLAKNTMILYVRMALTMAVSLFTSRVVLRILGFDDYGLYGVIGGVVTMFSFLNGAMSGASSRFISIEVGKRDIPQLNKVFSTLFFCHLIIAAIVLVLSETLGLWLLFNKLVIPEGQMTIAFWVFQISVIATLFSITVVPYSSMIIAHENMTIYAYVSLVEVALRLGIVYLLLLIPGPKLLVWAILGLCIQVGINIFYRIYVRRKYEGSKICTVTDRSMYRTIFGFVGGDLIGNIAVLAQGQGLNILLNVFFGPAVNAARSIAYSVQGVVQQFNGNFLTAMRPQVIKLYAEQRISEMMALMNRGSLLSFYLLWILVLPIMINTPYIIGLWLGKYPDYTIPFLRIILLIALVQSLKSPRTMVFHALGKIKWPNIIVGTILILAFPAAYVFLRLGYGPTSVFWVTLIDIFITELISVIILKRYLTFNGISYLVNVHLRCFFTAAVSALLPYWLHCQYPAGDFWAVIGNCLVCVASVIVSVLIIGINKSDRKILFSFIKRKFSRNA